MTTLAARHTAVSANAAAVALWERRTPHWWGVGVGQTDDGATELIVYTRRAPRRHELLTTWCGYPVRYTVATRPAVRGEE